MIKSIVNFKIYIDINRYQETSKIESGPDNYHTCITSKFYKVLEINYCSKA